MKVLQINVVYAKGSTGKIVEALHNEYISRGIDSIVLFGRGKKSKDPKIVRICSDFYARVNKALSMLTGMMYGGCFLSTNRVIKRIKRENPDVVHLHCLNGNFVNIYRLIMWLNKHSIPTVLTLHAEFMHTGNCSHALDCEKWKDGCGKCPRLKKETGSLLLDRTHQSWVKMKNSFSKFKNCIIVSVSEWLFHRASVSPILKDLKHSIVMNGVNTNVFKFKSSKPFFFKKNCKIVLHVTPFFSNDPNHIKGGYFLLQLAKKMSDLLFVVAGMHEKNIQITDNVVLLGCVHDQTELANYYSSSDLLLLTSKKETFSMVVAESLCCGTPVAGFYAGAPESICIEEYCKFVEYGDTDKLEKAIRDLLRSSFNRAEIIERATNKYSEAKMASCYLQIYRELCERN